MDTPDYDQELPRIRDQLVELFDHCDEGTLDDLARRLDVVIDIVARATGMNAVLQMAIAERMEEDTQQVPYGWLSRRQRRSTAGSDWEGARMVGKDEIIRRVALDIATGEVRSDWKAVAIRTIEMLDRTFSIEGLKLSGFRALGLDPDEYLVRKNAGWEVKVRKGM